jgi:hypothetical protein
MTGEIGNMKIRNGFVSNSSSSSFMIARRFVSDWQLEQIKGHIHKAYKIDPTHDWPSECRPGFVPGEWHCGSAWSISVDEDLVEGYTCMDNFDMHHFLDQIGIDMERVRFRHD